jgi:excisionase family DNA binding protein
MSRQVDLNPATMLTVCELATSLGVSANTIRRAARAGVLPAMRVVRGWRFERRVVALAKWSGIPTRREMERRSANLISRRSSQRSTTHGNYD